ncbi:MAG: trypsin-like serine protease, partial [Nocardioides sp.]
MNKVMGGVIAVVSGAAVIAPTVRAKAIVNGIPDAGEHPYVGQLLFYVPNAVDSRFDDPGGWFNCTGTLIDADTVVTAGHCAYDVGVEGVAPGDPLHGGPMCGSQCPRRPTTRCCLRARRSSPTATRSGTRRGRPSLTRARSGPRQSR